MPKITNTRKPIPLRVEFEKQFASEVIPVESQFIAKVVTDLDPVEASRLTDQWMDYVEDEYKEDCWYDYLASIDPKDLKSINKTKRNRAKSNEERAHERRKEWAKYEPFILKYFEDHPGQNITAARKRCAKHFGVKPLTIRRHTKGLKNPYST